MWGESTWLANQNAYDKKKANERWSKTYFKT